MNIKPQMNSAGYLVDILSAGTLRTDRHQLCFCGNAIEKKCHDVCF
ncbi:hypothetical protein MCEZEM1_01774 [Comamonadaceae bacterium]